MKNENKLEKLNETLCKTISEYDKLISLKHEKISNIMSSKVYDKISIEFVYRLYYSTKGIEELFYANEKELKRKIIDNIYIILFLEIPEIEKINDGYLFKFKNFDIVLSLFNNFEFININLKNINDVIQITNYRESNNIIKKIKEYL